MSELIGRFRYGILGLVFFLVILFFAITAEVLAWSWMLNWRIPPHWIPSIGILTVFVHASASLLAATAFLLLTDPTQRIFWGVLMFILASLMPVAGPLFCFLAFAIVTAPETASFMEDFKSDFEGESEIQKEIVAPLDDFEGADDEVAMLKRLDVQPLSDILASDDFMYKRDALTKLARVRSSMSVSLLRSTLDDEDPEIRFYASSALSRIEQDISKELNNLRTRVSEHPQDHAACLELIDKYMNVAELNFFPAETEAYYNKCALKLIDKYPNPKEVLVRQAKALCALKRHQELLNILEFEHALPRELLFYKCEALLKLTKFSILQQLCDIDEGPSECQSTIEQKAMDFWFEKQDISLHTLERKAMDFWFEKKQDDYPAVG